jgi:hypothetical protein
MLLLCGLTKEKGVIYIVQVKSYRGEFNKRDYVHTVGANFAPTQFLGANRA